MNSLTMSFVSILVSGSVAIFLVCLSLYWLARTNELYNSINIRNKDRNLILQILSKQQNPQVKPKGPNLTVIKDTQPKN